MPWKRRPIAERFWEKVPHKPDVGCWEWTANRSPNGYGMFSISRDRGKGAHRVSWELTYGVIPNGLYVCHHCDNKKCVRPDHLFLGTARDNGRDMSSKGRSVKGRRRPGTGAPWYRHNMTKLTDDKVTELRIRRQETGLSIYKLACEFGISKSQVYNIVTNAQRRAT